MKKRLMACLLAICLLASMLPPTALAVADEEKNDLSISASGRDKTITVTAKTGGDDEPGGDTPGGSVAGSKLSLSYDGKSAPIKRDYEQAVKVKVTNTSDQAVEYYLECVNSNEDLYMNFVSSGSKEAPLTIPADGEQEVTLSVFAQNATKTLYTIQVKAFVTGESDPMEMLLTFACEAAGGSVSLTKGNVDSATLTTTYTATNTGGKKITDLSLSIEGEAAEYVRISPSVENYELAQGAGVTVKLIPDLGKMKTDNKTVISGKLAASGGASKEEDISFDTQGEEITSMSMGQLALYQDNSPLYNLTMDENSLSVKVTNDGKETDINEYVEFNGKVDTADEIDKVLDVIVDKTDATFDVSYGSSYSYGENNACSMNVKVQVSTSALHEAPVSLFQSKNENYTYDKQSGTVTYTTTYYLTPEEYLKLMSDTTDNIGSYLSIQDWTGKAYETLNPDAEAYEVKIVETIVDPDLWTSFGIEDALPAVFDNELVDEFGQIGDCFGTASDVVDVYTVLTNPNIDNGTKTTYTGLNIVKNVLRWGKGAVAASPADGAGYIACVIGEFLIDWWLKDLESEMNNGVLYYDIYGRQCTNAGRVTSDFYVPDFGDSYDDVKIYETGRMYDGSPYGGNAGYAEDQFGGDSYIHNRVVKYDYYLNGEKVGETKNNGLTQVSIAEIGGKGLKPGKNTLVRDYNTNAGHYSVVADTEITILYPLDTKISYIGTPEGLEDVRSLPDFAVYSENILPTAAIIGEQTDVTVYVYNRGSRGGWVDISIGDGTTTFATQTNVRMDAFSEKAITFQWTPTVASTNFTVTLTNKSVNLDERKTDNNTASRTIAARSREVPEIGDITPTQVVLDGSSVRLIAGITKIADVKSVSFDVNGTVYEGNAVRLTALSDTAAQASVGVASSTLNAGNNTVKVTVTYQKNKTETATVEQTSTVQAKAPSIISFNIDSTVTDPQFYVNSNNGYAVSGVKVSPAADGTGYTLTNNAATSKDPGGYYLLTVCDGGVIVTGLDKLGSATLTLDGATEVTINSGEAALDRISLSSVSGNSLILNRELKLSDGSKLRISGSDSYSLYIRYKITGFSNRTYYKTVSQNDIVNGAIDLSKYFKLYRINLPADKGYDGNTDFNGMIQIAYSTGSADTYVEDVKYDVSANQLTLLLANSYYLDKLPGATGVQATITVDGSTVYVVDLKNYSAPVDASWNHYKVSFSCEQANDLRVSNTQLKIGKNIAYLWGDTIYLPSGSYSFLTCYSADGQQLYHSGELAISNQNVTVQLPGPVANPARVTFTWPSIWEDYASLSYSVQLPDGDIGDPSIQVSKDETITLPAKGSNWEMSLYRSEGDNQIAYARFKLELTLQEGGNVNVPIGNSFTGTANISGSSYEAGKGCWTALSSLKGEAGTELMYYYAERSAGYLNGRVTLTKKGDSSKVYTAPLSTNSIGSVYFTLPADMEAGQYTYEVFLTSAKIEGSQCSITFDANGGSGSMAGKTVRSGETFTLPTCGFTAPSNKTFKAWSIDGTEYAPGYVYTVAENITVSAVWKDKGTSSVSPDTSDNSGVSDTPTSTPSPVTTGKDGESGTTTTVKLTAVAKNNAAAATVSSSVGNEIVKQAEKNNSDNVLINLTVKGDVNETKVSVPASVVNQIGSKTKADLTVSTPVASVAIPNGGLGSLASMGGMINVTARQTGNTVELAVTSNGETVDSIPGGMVVTVPVEETKPGTVAVLVHENGAREVIRKSAAKDGCVVIPLNGSAKIEIVDNSKKFDDISEANWAANAVAFASSHELFNGTSETAFSPDLPMSRGMLAVVLHNLESNPGTALSGTFADVDNGQWYAEGVAWAAANGIVGGYGDGQFGPDDPITREQLAVMLWRYAGKPAASGTALNFADADKVSSWALDAMLWATEKGIVNGKGNGILDPSGKATRAETAQMLKNYLEN